MKTIKKYVKEIKEELESAEEYAEKYIEHKANGKSDLSELYKTMSEQELQHSKNIHDIATKEIQKISEVFTPTADMREKWDLSHDEYIKKHSWIKQMLSM